MNNRRICKGCGCDIPETRKYYALYCSKRCAKKAGNRQQTLRRARFVDFVCPVCGKHGNRRLSNGKKVTTCGAVNCIREWKKECNRRINREYRYSNKVWPSQTCSMCGCRTQRKVDGKRLCIKCSPRVHDRIKWPSVKLSYCRVCGKSKPVMLRCVDDKCSEIQRKHIRNENQKRKNARRNANPFWKMRMCISQQITSSIKRGRIWGKKKTSTFDMLGYTPNDLVTHLQNHFEFGMTWDNYGTEWHVDHVRPMSWFKGERDSIRRAWAITNLKPRWANNRIAQQHGGFSEGNAEKSDRYVA